MLIILILNNNAFIYSFKRCIISFSTFSPPQIAAETQHRPPPTKIMHSKSHGRPWLILFINSFFFFFPTPPHALSLSKIEPCQHTVQKALGGSGSLAAPKASSCVACGCESESPCGRSQSKMAAQKGRVLEKSPNGMFTRC